jgi:hypothetical protein
LLMVATPAGLELRNQQLDRPFVVFRWEHILGVAPGRPRGSIALTIVGSSVPLELILTGRSTMDFSPKKARAACEELRLRCLMGQHK